MLSPTLFSEEEGTEKPSPEIWHRALNRAGLDASQAMHVGDEIVAYVVPFGMAPASTRF